MSYYRTKLVGVLLILIAVTGCSGEENVIITSPEEQAASVAAEQTEHERILWGIWDISLDPVEDIVVVIPSRYIQAHYNVTNMILPPNCDDCFQVLVNSFDPVTRILDVDVTLRNPALLDGYDVRGILYTNDYGHELRNADDWTDLWEIPGGIDINPFRAYAKETVNRVFESEAEHTENYLVFIPVPPNYLAITCAVDASWPGNCREPYLIDDFFQDGELFDEPGSSVDIRVDVFDWQDDVSEVNISIPQITGDEYNYFIPISGNTWGLTLVNNLGAGAGEYEARLTAASTIPQDQVLNDIVTITVTVEEQQFNPVDVTPDWLNFSPKTICIEGDYLYIAAGMNGVHIFDITDPENTTWANKVDIPGEMSHIDADGDYAYVCTEFPSTYDQELHIIDVSDPYNTSLVNSLEFGKCSDFVVQDGYLFAADQSNGFKIFDIDPPESASLVNTLTSLHSIRVELLDGYAYVLTPETTLQIIDISNPPEAYVVDTFEFPGDNVYLMSVDYPYMGVFTRYDVSPYVHYSVFDVYDITAPLAPSLIHTTGEISGAGGLHLSGDRAYISRNHRTEVFGLNPEFGQLYYFDLQGNVCDVQVQGDYAFCATENTGLHVIDVSGSESAEKITSIYTPCYSMEISVTADNAFISGFPDGVQFYDISTYDLTHSAGGIDEVYVTDLLVSNDLLYLSDMPGLRVFDVSDISSPAHVIDVDTFTDGLRVVDINPIDTAELTKVVDLISSGGGHSIVIDNEYAYQVFSSEIEVTGGYAFLTAGDKGLMIVDMEPLEDAYLYKTIETPDSAEDLAVRNGYVFVADQGGTLEVFDVDPVESSAIVHSLPLSGRGRVIDISGNYAYVGTRWENRIDIVDISIPEAAFIKTSIDLPVEYMPSSTLSEPLDIVVMDNYVLLLHGYLGLKIYQLWE